MQSDYNDDITIVFCLNYRLQPYLTCIYNQRRRHILPRQIFYPVNWARLEHVAGPSPTRVYTRYKDYVIGK